MRELLPELFLPVLGPIPFPELGLVLRLPGKYQHCGLPSNDENLRGFEVVLLLHDIHDSSFS